MATDGDGIVTLVAFHGCTLNCKYCLNDFCHDSELSVIQCTPEELLKEVSIDELYYKMSGGGVVFGGGEPLLYSNEIEGFLRIAPGDWAYRVETSLNVEWESIGRFTDYIDLWIIDIKESNPQIYKDYTGCSNEIVFDNVKKLFEIVGREKILIRVPEIPKYNKEEDILHSIENFEKYGKIERFQYEVM